MATFKLTAPRNLGKVTKGFELMVPSSQINWGPTAKKRGRSIKTHGFYRLSNIRLYISRKLES